MRVNGIRIWQKLVILGLITLSLCAVPTLLYIRAAQKDIRSTNFEIDGLVPTAALIRLLQPVQLHRALSAGLLTGDQAMDKARIAKTGEITDAIDKARAALPQQAKPVHQALDKLAEEWKLLSAALKDKNMPMEENQFGHTRLAAAALKALEACIDYYGLSLDPESQSSFPIMQAYDNLPRLTETVSRLRALGLAILSIRQATTEERVTITALLERLREEIDTSRELLAKAATANIGGQKIDAAATVAINSVQKLIGVTDLEFVRIETLRFDAKEYLQLASAAIDAQYGLIQVLHGEIERTLRARNNKATKTMLGLVGLVAALLLLGAAAMFWIARSITRPLGDVVGSANAIAEGDLARDIGDTGSDEVGQVGRSMRLMRENLLQIVSRIRVSSDALGNAAREIAQSTQNMSSRAEEQASSLEQTAASMEELNSTFIKNDESSRHVNDLAAQAASAAEQGGVVVTRVTDTMQEISTASKRMSEIIGVIDGIAFQTNILALNAAVEAARAGEQGRGFAVVASEVRALAQRSGDAAKEIRTLIVDSAKKVQAGTRESAESRQAMDAILTAVRKVTSTMADMQTVREEQRRGVSQVASAVEQMNQGTQQTAAMIEEIAATTDMLSQQAQELDHAVAVFKLGTAQGADETMLNDRRARPAAFIADGQDGDAAITLSSDEIAREISENWRTGRQSILPRRPDATSSHARGGMALNEGPWRTRAASLPRPRMQ